jgi:precorrin-2/cobalt-factor-2 C20-methyltransferase
MQWIINPNRKEAYMKTGKFYGIGIGPGNPELLTLRALKILKKVDYIFQLAGSKDGTSVAGNIISEFRNDIMGKVINLTSPMKTDLNDRKKAWKQNAENILEKLDSGFNCAFITLGDPLIYSTCGHLIKELNNNLDSSHIEIIPGITSFQAAAAKTKTVLADNEEKLLIVPAYKDEIVQNNAVNSSDTVVMMKAYKTKNSIIKNIISDNSSGNSIYVSKLGLEGEVIENDIEKIKNLPSEYLSLFIIKKKEVNKQ